MLQTVTQPGATGSVQAVAIRDLDLEGSASRGIQQAHRSAVRGNDLMCDGKAQSRAAPARGALKGLEQVLAGARRHARSIVADNDMNPSRVTLRSNADRAAAGRLDRLQRVAREI